MTPGVRRATLLKGNDGEHLFSVRTKNVASISKWGLLTAPIKREDKS